MASANAGQLTFEGFTMKNHRLNLGELEYLAALLNQAAELRIAKGLKPTSKMLAIVEKLNLQIELLQ